MKLRIMTYNVRYFAHALRGAGSTRGCLSAVAAAIAQLEHPPDIICLQEVETRSLRSHFSFSKNGDESTQLDALISDLDRTFDALNRSQRYHGYYFPAHQYAVRNQPIYTTGLAVLAREGLDVDEHNVESPEDITHRRLDKVKHLKQSRICAYVRIKDARGGCFEVFNTHLSLPAFATKRFFSRAEPNMGYGQNQHKEIESLLGFVDRRRRGDHFMLMGDFNSLPGSPAYQRLLDHGGLTDPFPSIVGETPLELRTSWPTAGFMNLRMRLDHLLVGPGFTCRDFEDTHPYGAAGRWHGLSDHVPLLGRFEAR